MPQSKADDYNKPWAYGYELAGDQIGPVLKTKAEARAHRPTLAAELQVLPSDLHLCPLYRLRSTLPEEPAE